MTLALYTIGHGTRQIGELMALLKQAGVDTLVDVRAQPHSRHNPQFNDDVRKIGVRDGFSDSEIQKRNNTAARRESATLVYDRQVSGELDLESVPPGPKTTM